jgi:glutamyl-tRNA reductase
MAPEDPALFLLGTSHRVASLEERERISLPADSIDEFYEGLRQVDGMDECLLLNTCNRTEIYGVGNGSSPLHSIRSYLGEFRKLDDDFLQHHLFEEKGEAVVRHAFEVAAGIDSQMVGETEILGQVKNAYDDALRRKSSGKMLNRVFQKSFQAAKWARTQTGISKGQVNLGNVICELTRRIFGDVAASRLLAIGSGEVAETVLTAFHSRGASAITVTGRSFDKAHALAEEVKGSTLDFSAFRDSLHLFDVVVSSTAGDNHVLSREIVKEALAKRPARPLFLIDLAMPRDVEESVGELENVYLYNLDDVSAIANENLANRKSEVERCKDGLSIRAKRIWDQLVASPRSPS